MLPSNNEESGVGMGAIINLAKDRTLLKARLLVAEKLLVEMVPQELSVIVYVLCDGSLNRSKTMLSRVVDNDDIADLFLNYVSSVWHISEED